MKSNQGDKEREVVTRKTGWPEGPGQVSWLLCKALQKRSVWHRDVVLPWGQQIGISARYE